MVLRQFKTPQCPAASLAPLPGTSAPAKEAAEWNHPSHVIARYSSPFKVRLHPYENILRLQLSAQFTAYATNPQRITKLNTKFFPAHLFSPSLVVRLQVLLKGKGHLSEEI